MHVLNSVQGLNVLVVGGFFPEGSVCVCVCVCAYVCALKRLFRGSGPVTLDRKPRVKNTWKMCLSSFAEKVIFEFWTSRFDLTLGLTRRGPILFFSIGLFIECFLIDCQTNFNFSLIIFRSLISWTWRGCESMILPSFGFYDLTKLKETEVICDWSIMCLTLWVFKTEVLYGWSHDKIIGDNEYIERQILKNKCACLIYYTLLVQY